MTMRIDPVPTSDPTTALTRQPRARALRVRGGRSVVVVLDALAGVVALAAAVLFVWPARPSVTSEAPRIAADLPAASQVGGALEVQPIVDGNLFSATRRAPTVLFRPPGAEGEQVPPIVPVDANVGGEGTSYEPRLFGIVAQDGVRRALLLLPGTDSVPRLLSAGERRAGYRVVTIGTDRVVLSSAGGTRTVRLLAPVAPDSLENEP